VNRFDTNRLSWLREGHDTVWIREDWCIQGWTRLEGAFFDEFLRNLSCRDIASDDPGNVIDMSQMPDQLLVVDILDLAGVARR
jgi:hypothetical protein